MEPGSGGRMVAIRPSPHDGQRVILSGDMLGLGVSTDGGASWGPVFGLMGYEMADVTWHPTDPDVVWVGSMSGPAISRDGGHTFTPMRRGMPPLAAGHFSAPIEAVLFDPNDEQRLIAVGGSSRDWRPGKNPQGMGVIWESTDGGEHWHRLCTLTPGGSSADPEAPTGIRINGAAFAAGSSTRLYVATRDHGVYVSDDGGRSWANANVGLPHLWAIRMIAHPDQTDTAWVSLNSKGDPPAGQSALPGGVFKTTDGGARWFPISEGLTQLRDTTPPRTSRYEGFAVSPTNPDRMVAFDGSYRVGVGYLTLDGGQTWKPTVTRRHFDGKLAEGMGLDASGVQKLNTMAYPSGMSMEFVAFDPSDENRVYAVGASYALKSSDGGFTWEDVTADEAGPSTLGMAYRGRGYSGLVAKGLVFDPYTPGRSMLQAMDSARVWLSVDDLQTWTYHGKSDVPWHGGQRAAFGRDGHFYAAFGQYGFHGVGYSHDDGLNWTVVIGPDHGLPTRKGKRAKGLAVHAEQPKTLWLSVDDRLFESNDGGASWKMTFDAAVVGNLLADPLEAGWFYMTTDAGVYRSNGKVFRAISGPKFPGAIAADREGHVYATAYRDPQFGGAWRYEPDEQTWTRIFDHPQVEHIAVDPHRPGRLALATSDRPYHDAPFSTGVHLSADGGLTWGTANHGLPFKRVRRVSFDPHTPGRLVAGTGGRGFFITDWPVAMGVPNLNRMLYADDDDVLAAPASAPGDVAPQTPGPDRDAGLIRNGDMSEATDGRPVGWSVTWTGAGAITLAQDTASDPDNPTLRAISKDDATRVLIGQRFTADGTVKVSGRVRSNGPAKVSLGLRSRDEQWGNLGQQQLHFVQNQTNWESFEAEAELPAGAADHQLGLFISGAGTVWLDDVEVMSAGTDEPS
jgi:photosystem II stability/assembly factor-like uncharacterized protein